MHTRHVVYIACVITQKITIKEEIHIENEYDIG